MTKEEVLEKVKAVAEAPSCYGGLKDVIKSYCDGVGTAGEKAAAEKLIAALEECVEPIDATIEFLKSEKGKEILGADTAAAVLKTAEDAKAKGEKICPCPACQNGKTVLENRAVLLA